MRDPLEREFLLAFWKIHILHHAGEQGVYGQWMLVVPSSSIASTTGRTFVVRVRDGRTEWVDVRSGLTDGAAVEVFGELHAGDQVAARGTDEIPAGTEVEAHEAGA